MTTANPDSVIPHRKIKDDADLDITPMIDITFLLLAFFVMVSKMDPQIPVKLPQALNGQAIPERNCVVLVVIKGAGTDEYNIYKGRTKDESALVRAADPVEQEAEIADYVENQLSQYPNMQGVLIKAEGDIKTGSVEIVKRGVATSELGRTRQLYVAVESPQ